MSHHHILAFVDTSSYATSVCDYAAWIAKHTGFRINLIHIIDRVEPPTTNMSGTIGLGAKSHLLDKLAALDAERAQIAQAHGRAILAEARTRISQTNNSLVSNEILRTDGIADAVQTIDPNTKLVVVGKRGDTRDIDSGLIGTNLEAVIRSSPVPVLVANRAFTEPKKFLIAYDGAASSTRAVEHIIDNQGLDGCQGLIVSVGKKSESLDQDMHHAAERLKHSGKPCDVRWFDTDSVESAIATCVNKDSIDLLVMGAYGHSRIRNWVIGSTTTAMVQRCKVPILMFR